MKRIVIHKAGGYNRLKLETAPDPKAGPGEVVVRVAAAGVNFADVKVRLGIYESAKRLVGWPITPGFEYSGEVIEVGTGVTKFKPGDQVFGLSFFNSYASHVKVPQQMLWFRPSELSVEEAGGFFVPFLTAFYALMQTYRIQPGLKVLIHSAGGGVGSALVQIAKLQGLYAVGAVGTTSKVDYVKGLGADIVIDKSKHDLWTEAKKVVPQGFDLILDANGTDTLQKSYENLRPTGKLIIYGGLSMRSNNAGKLDRFKFYSTLLRIPRFDPIKMAHVNKSVLAFNLSFLFQRLDLMQESTSTLLKWLAENKIKPLKTQSLKLEDAAEAHRAIESGQTTGKLVLLC